MEMKENLLSQSAKQSHQTADESRYFIQRYNDVIEMYNENSAGTPGQYLEIMDVNPFFKKINRRLSYKWVQLLLIISLTLIPIFNLFCFGFLWFYYFHLQKQSKVHKKNINICKDPFKQFYFLPEICCQLGKHATQMTIQTKDLQGFTFNEQLYDTIKSKHGYEDSINVIIYDQYFYDSFHLFKKQMYKIVGWIIVSVLLIGANVLIMGSIFQWY